MISVDIFRNAKEVQSFAAGQTIFEEGEPGELAYVVQEGDVDIMHGGQVIETVGRGGLLGEMALIDTRPRSARAVARTDAKLVAINDSAFLFYVQYAPQLALEVMSVIGERLRRRIQAGVEEKGSGKSAGLATLDVRNAADAAAFAPGAIIFQAGDPADKMFAVAEGEVEIRLGDRLIDRVGPGGILGEMALVDDKPRSATAIARTESKLVPISRERFLTLVQQKPLFSLDVLQIMAERLRRRMEAST
jgi:CRP-like cAMP-binding protein